MAESKKEVLKAIVEGVTACYRVTFCTCQYKEAFAGKCDHCRIRRALMAASNYIANGKDEQRG